MSTSVQPCLLTISPFPLRNRRVVLSRGQLGVGITLVGGRGNGIFISSNRSNTHGLQNGDQIIQVSDLCSSSTSSSCSFSSMLVSCHFG